MAAMSPQKRKRDSQDIPDMRAAPGMDPEDMNFEQYTMATEDDGQDIDFGGPPLAPQSHNEVPLMHDTSLQQPQQPQQQQQPEQSTTNHQRSHSQNQSAIPSASDTATAALAHHYTMSVPQPTENTFMHQPTEGGDRVSATPVDHTPVQRSASFGDMEVAGPNGDASSPTGAQATSGGSKPTVGSDEWHKVRRDNHKEVERRRRETINEGINEIAKIVPGCEKNKGSILARAVQFITQLKDNETQNIEKWTLEKLLTEQAISELSASCDKLKNECQRAWAECEQWKKAAQKAGVTSVDSVEGDAKAATGEDAE